VQAEANQTPVFTWYTHHNIPGTPINPSSPYPSAVPHILPTETYPTLSSLSLLPHPSETSVSIIAPPKITKKVLEEAKKLGVRGLVTAWDIR
jgi:CoA binding domain